jgi:predicted Zn-dependent protease
MKTKNKCMLVMFVSAILVVSCDKDRGVNLFSLNQDIEFGEVMDSTIRADSDEYPILSRTEYPDAYAYMDNMMQDILNSEKFKYAEKFDWEITIINKDVLNAFAVPGGKLYFYTGLMKYLDKGASIAGVLGHEMAHADLRHSTKTMTDVYGFSLLVSLLLGDNSSKLVEIAGDLATGAASLKFSRNHESDADRYSMYYLSTTKYDPKGIGNFFTKLQDEGQTQSTFEFLSTHPSDDTRLEQVDEVWESDAYLIEKKSGRTYSEYEDEYQSFLNTLP